MTIIKSRGESFRLNYARRERAAPLALDRYEWSQSTSTKFPTSILMYKQSCHYTGDSYVPRTEPRPELRSALFNAETRFRRSSETHFEHPSHLGDPYMRDNF